jgi:hypothetical protein
MQIKQSFEVLYIKENQYTKYIQIFEIFLD